jgi:LacI family transcriptional regulator
MSRRPTIADVAAAASVSTATVDRVLNSRLPVREATAIRVIAAADRIAYHAAGLMRERLRERAPLRTLGFCLQKRADPFYQAFAGELSAAAARRAPQRCVALVEYIDEIEPAAIAKRLLAVGELSDAVAVVAVDHPHVAAAIETLAGEGKPVFTLLSDLSAPARAGYVGVDPRKAGRTAAWAISRLARRDGEVGVFVGSHRYLGQETCEIAFRSYLREHAPQFRVLDTRVNLEDERLALEATQELLARHADLVGLYAAGGGVPGIVRALREHDRHVVTVCNELTSDRRHALIDGVIDLVIGTPLPRVAETAVAMMLRALELLATGAGAMTASPFPQPFDLYTPENV